MEDTKKA